MRRTATVLLALLPLAWPWLASGDGFMPIREAVAMIADGNSWTGTRPNGETMRLTLRPDRTGRFDGPISRDVTWATQGEALCIAFGLPIGSRCLRFVRRGQGIHAHDHSGFAFSLSR